MKKEMAKILCEKFPLLYSTNNKRPFGIFGFECSEGWFELLYNLSAKLEPLIEQYIKEAEDPEDYPRAAQVKEKFGGLRFYMSHATEEMYKIIAEAERICWKICEDCGKPGEISIDGYWYRTLCSDCIDKYNKGFIDEYGQVRIRNYIQCSELKKGENNDSKKEKESSNEKDGLEEDQEKDEG
jgi:hypothetical protein